MNIGALEKQSNGIPLSVQEEDHRSKLGDEPGMIEL